MPPGIAVAGKQVVQPGSSTTGLQAELGADVVGEVEHLLGVGQDELTGGQVVVVPITNPYDLLGEVGALVGVDHPVSFEVTLDDQVVAKVDVDAAGVDAVVVNRPDDPLFHQFAQLDVRQKTHVFLRIVVNGGAHRCFPTACVTSLDRRRRPVDLTC